MVSEMYSRILHFFSIRKNTSLIALFKLNHYPHLPNNFLTRKLSEKDISSIWQCLTYNTAFLFTTEVTSNERTIKSTDVMTAIWWMYSKTEDTQVSAMREKQEHIVLVIAWFCTCNTVQSVTAFCGNVQTAVTLLLHSSPSLW